MTRAVGWLLVLLVMVGASAVAGPLSYSGVLGQSQPPGAEPLPFVGAIGAAIDSRGMLWTGNGSALIGLKPDAKPSKLLHTRLPAGVSSLGLRWDGERIYVAGTDRKLYSLVPREGKVSRWGTLVFSRQVRSFAVAPDGLNRGFAATAKVFILDGDNVSGFGRDGAPAGDVLKLSRPADAKWWYCAVGIEPTTGDLLVGSYHPDSKVYRFDADGREVISEGWPRPGHAASIINIDGQAWLLRYGSGAVSLPLRQDRQTNALRLGGEWSMYTTGLAQDNANYWLASSQGLTRWETRGELVDQRVGGISDVKGMAVAADGTLIAAMEANGQRMIRLGIDDLPSTPLRCNANEPWRVGAGWTGAAAGIVWDGVRFLVLDPKGGRLWQFDPWHTGWGEKPWITLTKPRTYRQPTALAAGDIRLWVVDQDRVLEADVRRPEHFRALNLIGVRKVAAADDELLYCSDAASVKAFARDALGKYTLKWVQRIGQVAGLAASSTMVVVSDPASQRVVAMSRSTGEILAQVGPVDVPGGLEPGALAISGRWVLVYDDQGKRIVRLRLDGIRPEGVN